MGAEEVFLQSLINGYSGEAARPQMSMQPPIYENPILKAAQNISSNTVNFLDQPNMIRTLYGQEPGPSMLDMGSQVGELAANLSPGLGDVLAAKDAVQSAAKEEYLNAFLSGLGAIPLLGMVGDVAKGLGKTADVALDMSKEARLARAAEQGFDTKQVAYHGTPDSRELWKNGFKTRAQQLNNPLIQDNDAFFFTDSARVAGTYADDARALDYQNATPEILSTYLKTENPKIIDWGGQVWKGTDKAIREAKKEGYDSIIIKNVIDDYNTTAKAKPTTVRVVFKPNQIRSINAAFNPSKADSSDLLASMAPLAALGLYKSNQGE